MAEVRYTARAVVKPQCTRASLGQNGNGRDSVNLPFSEDEQKRKNMFV